MNKTGLVLAGGGVKGSYHIGVWRALKEMGIEIDVVVGTSIGSVNGALFAMGAYETAEKLWTEITIDKIVNIEAQSDNLFDIKNMMAIANEFYKNNGIDVTPFKKLLNEVVDEEKIRGSSVDFGLVTHSLTDHKEEAKFKADIPEGQLVEYILASACLPGFKSQRIDDKEYIDGAVSNNMPVDMLIERGIKNIIAVDVGGIGIVKSVNTTGINLITIKCSENVLGTMDFNSENIAKNIKMGYYDCYKTLGRLMGDKYYFNSNDYCIARSRYSEEIMQGLEYAADVFKINKLAVYKVDALIDGIMRGYRAAEKRYNEMKNSLIKDGVFDILGKGISQIDDAVMVAWIVDQLKSGNVDFMNNKIVMGILGDNFTAANVILYLLDD